jgi:hypothetical protein
MKNNLIVPWEQSKWLVCSSLFFAVPSVQAFVNKQYYCSGLLIATSLASVNYWMIASYSWRRDLDLIISKVSFGVFFVNGLIYSKLPFRIVVYPSTGLILGSYYISQKLFELNSSYWYKYHMMFHFFSCTNIMFILQSIK